MTSENTTDTPTLSLLLLDDEQSILNSLKRLLRKEYQLVTFTEGQEALAYLKENHVDIMMSDMRMPNMDGAEFLSRAKKIIPNAIRILLTGYSDLESTIKAINEGGVYTYIGKPWDNEALQLTLAKAAEHYKLKIEKQQLTGRLANANKELEQFNQQLEQKVNQRTQALQVSKQKLDKALIRQQSLFQDVLEMMSATIEYRTGLGSGYAKRIALQAKVLAAQLKLDEFECRRIHLCAMLHEIGTVGLTDDMLKQPSVSGGNLDETFANHPVIGANIIGQVKRFEPLTATIRHQNENIDGSGLPDHLTGDEIPIGARIIRVVKDFDFLIAGKQNKKKIAVDSAKTWLKKQAGVLYDKSVVDAFLYILDNKPQTEELDMIYSVGLETIRPGDVLTEDLTLDNGNTMLTAGQEVSAAMISKLRQYEKEYNTQVTLFID
ncbi:HD domain-containing phosphohydrolase [Thalassomonas haliotis]|uniref:Response regulator n=1 Tax=Thalassomonas haliotis TaxID=485448 RepID=A0ABY7VBF1_9GAMM|nr:HD domain-containing phosphohydrolase [Thalassomonas haliotis]WDE10223.1 response regulator [Thalassomonas haliotis]